MCTTKSKFRKPIEMWTIATFCAVSVFFIGDLAKANEGDDCGFGRLDLGYPDCMDYFWTELDNNDGFTRTYAIYIDGDNTSSDDSDFFMEVQCSSKKLAVVVYADPVGMYPDVDRRGLGTALVRIDGGKIQKYSYRRMRDSSGISLQSPKTLTKAMLRGGTKLAFKIPAIYGPEVANFAIADFSAFESKFKTRGCPLR